MELKTGINDDMRRLDRIIRKALPEYPLSLIHRLLRQGKIKVNGKKAEPQDKIPSGSSIVIRDQGSGGQGSGVFYKGIGVKGSRVQGFKGSEVKDPNSNIDQQPAACSELPNNKTCYLLPATCYLHSPDSQLPILWQDNDLLIINKPAGMAVHGAQSLDLAVRQYLENYLSQPDNKSLSFKSGPLHRLDKPTSGIIVFSKSLEGARSFSSLLREGKIQKYYLAIVEGNFNKEEVWENLITRDKTCKKSFISDNNALSAKTTVQPLAVSTGRRKFSLIQAQIHTGRTHQIRAQAAARGYPLAGDVKYGGKPLSKQTSTARGFYLHAWKMKINEIMEITAPLPAAFQEMARELFKIELHQF